MDTLVLTITEFVQTSFDWVSQLVEHISTQPLILILCVGVPVTGFAVGLLKRLINL